jgi:hypothetical protein
MDKQELEELYLRRHLTMEEIGKIYGKTRSRICQLIKMYGIPKQYAQRFPVKCDKCGKEYALDRCRFRKTSTHYCSMTCYMLDRKVNGQGYYPDRQGQRYARQVMAKHIGRPLITQETVHHIDGNCSNNSIDNLVLFPSHSSHVKWHHLQRRQQHDQ